jgi:hypothetical protein
MDLGNEFGCGGLKRKAVQDKKVHSFSWTLLIVMGEDLTKKGFITKARGAHRKPLAEVIL